jgi:hypothetical protein
MTNTDRIEALEAQVALLTGALRLGDPLEAARMVALPPADAGHDEGEAPAEPEVVADEPQA